MLEVIKSLIAENFENDLKQMVHEYIIDGEKLNNDSSKGASPEGDILTGIASSLNDKYNSLLQPIYNKYLSKFIYDAQALSDFVDEQLKDFVLMGSIRPFIKFDIYNKFYVNDDALFDALSDFVDDDLFDVIC